MNHPVDNCLAHNGSLYARTKSIDGLLMEICELPQSDASNCKYYQPLISTCHPLVPLCLYEIYTYESGGHDVFPGEDFTMRCKS